jgi:hypothetical protein
MRPGAAASLVPGAPLFCAYERTLVLAIEVSNKSWVLAAQVPGLPHSKAKRTIDPEAEALLAAIAGYRTRAVATGCRIERAFEQWSLAQSGATDVMRICFAGSHRHDMAACAA